MAGQIAELEVLRKELKAEVEKAKATKKREFKGFKATLVIANADFTYEIPVRYAKMDSRVVDEKMNIRSISRSTKEPVQQKYITKVVMITDDGKIVEDTSLKVKLADGREATISAVSKKAWITASGKEVPAEDVMYIQNIDGKDVEVEKFERTKEIVVERFIPIDEIDDFLSEGEYEIWAEEPRHIAKLKSVAEYMKEKGVAGFCSHFSFGGFKAYAGIIYPVFKEDGFVFVMRLTRMRKQYKRLMPLEVKVEERPAKPKPRPVFLF